MGIYGLLLRIPYFVEICWVYDHHEWDKNAVGSLESLKLVELDRLTVSSDSKVVQSL